MTDRKLPNRRRFLSGTAATVVAASLPLQLDSSVAIAAAGQKAPLWEIQEWINGDAGNVDTLKGKVIVIDFFQLWCPGCNKFSGPLLDHWQAKFAKQIDAGQLVLVKIHTVFEGHGHQTVKRLKSYVKEKGITLPVGVDRHIDGARLPETMRRYKTRGTPEMAIIDTDGVIRFQRFGYFEPSEGEALILDLLKRATA